MVIFIFLTRFSASSTRLFAISILALASVAYCVAINTFIILGFFVGNYIDTFVLGSVSWNGLYLINIEEGRKDVGRAVVLAGMGWAPLRTFYRFIIIGRGSLSLCNANYFWDNGCEKDS